MELDVTKMRRILSNEVMGKIKEMVDRGFSCRRIAKELKEHYNLKVSHMWVYRHFVKGKIIAEKAAKKLPRTPLSINIEAEILSRLKAQLKERTRPSLSDIINDKIGVWFNNIQDEDIANQVLTALNKHLAKFKDRRRKYQESIKTTIHINKKLLEKLEDLQSEIDSLQTDDFLLHWVRPNSKMTLEDTIDVWKDAELLETSQQKHKPNVSISQIINIILDFESK